MSKQAGIYCKAYHLRDLRAYAGWTEQTSAARPASESGSEPRTLDDDSVVYLQADMTVTDDIFLGEHVLFSGEDAEWRTFCSDVLGFAVPEDVLEADRQARADVAAAAD